MPYSMINTGVSFEEWLIFEIFEIFEKFGSPVPNPEPVFRNKKSVAHKAFFKFEFGVKIQRLNSERFYVRWHSATL